jgi:hypothetical protein
MTLGGRTPYMREGYGGGSAGGSFGGPDADDATQGWLRALMDRQRLRTELPVTAAAADSSAVSLTLLLAALSRVR